MPQNGFHALIGAAVGRRVWPGRVPWVLGFIVGSMVPDVDILPLAVLRLAGNWTEGIHRTATHSVFLIGVAFVTAGLGWKRSRVLGAFAFALGLGVLGHIGLDLLLWFAGVNLLWPLSEIRGWREVNLWRGVKLPAVGGNPDFIGNELAAVNPLAFALYFGYLGRVARGAGVETRAVRFARGVKMVCWGLFPVYAVTGVFLAEWGQSLVVYPLVIAVFLPAALAASIALRRPLAGG